MAQNLSLSRTQKILATAGVALALLLASLDQTIVGTAMPRIIAELRGLNYYAWVTTAYLVTSTVVVPIAGKLGDMFGRKPFVLAGMIGFVGASALCGLSQNMVELVLFRGTQGLFGGMLFASVFTVLADIFPIEQRARMQGIFGGVFGLSSVVGPTIGGYLTDGPGWRWVFYVNVPIGVLAVLLVSIALPFVRSRAQVRDIDWLGSIVLAAGVVPMLIAFSLTNTHKWSDPEVVGPLAFSALALIGFFLIERRAVHPIVPFELFKNNVFTVSVLVAFFSAIGMFGSILFVPLLYQGVLAVSATHSGQLVTPMMLGMIAFSTLAGQVMPRVRYYRFIGTLGVGTMIAGMLLLTQIGVGTSQWRAAFDIVVIGAGLGLTFPLTVIAVQSALPRQFLGVATSQVQFWRNLGGTMGSAVLGSVLANRFAPAVSDQLTAHDLPAQFTRLAGVGPQALFDPAYLASVEAVLPPQAAPLIPRFIEATRLALADTLHELFLIAAGILVIALVATLFMREVPLRSTGRGAMAGEAPPAPEAAEAAEQAREAEAATA
ncbi:MAG TPA: MDR family MFS transporter [Candidatus Dormibacteraeota bacterium]|nr:MDR family MFS transporter [Candidatus Dormibacteraeota bacterium]